MDRDQLADTLANIGIYGVRGNGQIVAADAIEIADFIIGLQERVTTIESGLTQFFDQLNDHDNGLDIHTQRLDKLTSLYTRLLQQRAQPARKTMRPALLCIHCNRQWPDSNVYVVYDDEDLSSEGPVRIATFYTETAAFDFAGRTRGYRYEIEPAQQPAPISTSQNTEVGPTWPEGGDEQ